MEMPHLKPFLHKEDCEEHGLTNFIVDNIKIDAINKKVEFVFYCKKCWLAKQEDTTAWAVVLPIHDFNTYFGTILKNDN